MDIKKLSEIENILKRKMTFMAGISRLIWEKTQRMPVIVGGHAVEMYTHGGYTSEDIDVKAPREALASVLQDLGFEHDGMHFFHKDLDIYIQWLGEGVDPVFENPDRTIDIEIDPANALYVRVIGGEDLVIDRLMAYKFWKDSDSKVWASRIIDSIGQTPELSLDVEYMRKRANEEDVCDVLDEILAEYPPLKKRPPQLG